MKRRVVFARFSDGSGQQRESVSKVYTHAYCWMSIRKIANKERPDLWPVGDVSRHTGFSTSRAQCERNQRNESAWARRRPEMFDLVLLPIVEVEEVT